MKRFAAILAVILLLACRSSGAKFGQMTRSSDIVITPELVSMLSQSGAVWKVAWEKYADDTSAAVLFDGRVILVNSGGVWRAEWRGYADGVGAAVSNNTAERYFPLSGGIVSNLQVRHDDGNGGIYTVGLAPGDGCFRVYKPGSADSWRFDWNGQMVGASYADILTRLSLGGGSLDDDALLRLDLLAFPASGPKRWQFMNDDLNAALMFRSYDDDGIALGRWSLPFTADDLTFASTDDLAGRVSVTDPRYLASITNLQPDVSLGRLSVTNDLHVTNNLYVAGNIVLSNAVRTLAYSASVTTDVSRGSIYRLTLAGNLLLANPTNAVDGVSVRWLISQGVAGGHAITLGDKFTLPSSASSPLAWSTAAGARDLFAAMYDASVDRWLVVSMVPGY